MHLDTFYTLETLKLGQKGSLETGSIDSLKNLTVDVFKEQTEV